MTTRFHSALAYASLLHHSQVRKGSEMPYVAHLLGVCANALTNGADETEAIAALLHDAAEDQGGEEQLDRISALFGQDVERIVRACSDSVVDTTKRGEKAPWTQRKRDYLDRLEKEDDPAILLVSAADKLDNLRAIVRDYETLGDELWRRFSGGKQGTLWYYERVVAIFDEKSRVQARLAPIARELRALYELLPVRDPSYEPAGAPQRVG
jgi:(p)ppGpp synthase/HD superfamily hydrolase